MAGRYDPLGDYLRAAKGESCELMFEEIESIIGERLPRSATLRRWWSNNTMNRSQSRAWTDAGWLVHACNTKAEVVEFRKKNNHA